MGSDRSLRQVKAWANDLLDMTKRNTSLYYRPLKRGTLTFVSPEPELIHDQLAGQRSVAIYHPPSEDLVDELWTLEQCLVEAGSEMLVSDRTARSEVVKTLRNLETQYQADFLDRGLESLYVCFGMLKWREVPGADESSSPLIFVPVQLERESPRDDYRIKRADGDTVLNPSLRVLLDQDFGITLPHYDPESSADDGLESFFGQIRESVREQGWGVEPAVVLKRATFHKEAMYKDLLDNLEQVASDPIVESLADPAAAPTVATDDHVIPDEDAVDDVAPPEESHLIMDADSSQRRAIVAALRGSSVVIDGPPGTGKSQTISNLIAELMADGKSVLFVSEKIAALDVVAKRLKERGLREFLLELHSHKISRREVAMELGRSLTRRPTAEPWFTKADAQRYRKARVSLSEYATAVNRVREPLGRSVHWVLGRLAQLDSKPSVEPPETVSADLSAEDVATFSNRFEQLARVWEPAERGEMFEWRGLDVADLSQAARTELLSALEDFKETLATALARSEGLAYAAGLPVPEDLASAQVVANVCSFARSQPMTEQTWWSRDDLEPVASRIQELAAVIEAQTSDIAALQGSYGERWQELDPASAGEMSNARSALDALSPAAALSPRAMPEAIARRIEFLRSSEDLARAIAADGPYLAAAVGASEKERSVARIRKIAAVAADADSPHRPERRWAVPAVAAQVQRAIENLTPLVDQYQERYERLAEHFEPAVYELDLRGLVTRFHHVHHGWRKLGRLFRDDKRAVAAVARSRRANKTIRAMLPDALEVQQVAQRLDEQESGTVELLGRYYRPRASELTAAKEALQKLRRAADVLEDEYNAEQVAAQLAGDAPADLELGSRAQRVLEQIESWRQTAETTRFDPDVLEAMSPADLERWATQALSSTHAVSAVLGDASAIRSGAGDLDTVQTELERRTNVEERSATMRGIAEHDAELLGVFAVGFDTDTDRALAGLRWVEELRGVSGGPLPPSAAAQLHDRAEPPDHRPLQDTLNLVGVLVDKVAARFVAERQDELRQELLGELAHAQEVVGRLLSTPDKIDVWHRYVTLSREREVEGWASPIAGCRSARVPAAQLSETLEKAMYVAWFDAIAADDSVIANTRGSDLDATVQSFRTLDEELIKNAAEVVVGRCNERRPKTIMGASKVISTESEKKRKHMPVRELLARAGDVATALKPCFMMSPLSVSQFIPSDMRFDVVIFDEASQVTPSDAINCIYRGSQLVVAGDDKQLPPTSFFDRMSGDDGDDVYDEEQLEDFESVLKLCKGAAGLPSMPLRWHYRSQHESLITFSNYRFYEGNLITYPGAKYERGDLGVELRIVDGVYERGGSRTNRVEAEAVVERVLHHADTHPDQTVGVVTFSVPQKDMIENLLAERQRARPDLDDWFKADRLDGFFVKNLESVQGDERDIMIFSIGYGPDEYGDIKLNFGPLSRSGGWRRLNVAITRARRRVEVVASFHPSRLNTSGSRHVGVKELQKYLDFAERGISALAIDLSQSEGDVESPLEQSIFDTIRQWGYDVVPQVGTAGYRVDLGIRHPERAGEFMLGVECDGRAYHSSRIARDRDRLRQEVLEGLGWRLHRIWGPSWYRDRQGQEARLREVLADCENGTEPLPQSPIRPATPVTEREHEEVSLEERPTWVKQYKIARVSANTPYYPYEPEAFGETAMVVKAVLDVEAPIHMEFLARRVADAFDCNLTQKVRKAVSDAVLTLARQQKCTVNGEWVWVSNECPIRVPAKSEEVRRDVEQIPPEELDSAVFQLLRDAHSARDEELVTQIGRLFGIRRVSARARGVLEEAVSRLHNAGRIERLDDGRLRPL